MSDLLSDWIGQCRSQLETHGFKVTEKDQHEGGSRSVNLDSSLVVGTITHWPEEQFEFQFSSCATGDVLAIEERSFSSVDDLNSFFDELRKEKLSSAV